MGDIILFRRTMRITSGVVSGVSRLARLEVELLRKARQRLKWFDHYKLSHILYYVRQRLA